jgi:hypothetical protein
MNKTAKHVLVLPILLAAVTLVSPASASSSVVHDLPGDSLLAAPYMDVVHAKVTEQKGKETLFFMMKLAGGIPDVPSGGHLIWPFHVDTNAATAPGGLYNEYIVLLRWVNGEFVGQVINRTPLLTGGTPIVTIVPFRIDGTTVKVFVGLDALGNPTSFGWNASTRPGPTAPYADFAPDGGVALATWRQ